MKAPNVMPGESDAPRNVINIHWISFLKTPLFSPLIDSVIIVC